MADNISGREKKLAAKIGKLSDEAARPQIEGGGWLGDALNFLASKAPVLMIRAALIVFVGYEAYAYFMKGQQFMAEVIAKRAKATSVEAEAKAAAHKIGIDIAEVARAKATLEKIRSDAAAADAEAKAQGQRIGDTNARLASIRADIEKAQNEAARLNAEVAAYNQNIAGMPLIVAKKRNEVEAAETAEEQEVWTHHLMIEGMKRGDWRLYLMGPMLGRNPEEDGIRRYSMREMFDELHGQMR